MPQLPSISTLFPYTTLFRSVVFVSHDRYFIDKLATRVFEIGDGRVEVYPGNYEDYRWRKGGGAARLQEAVAAAPAAVQPDRKSTRLNSSHVKISYAVFCLKK